MIAPDKRPQGFAVVLLVAATIGLTAAFALAYEKFFHLLHPDTHPSCDFSVVVQCGKNLMSWQGSLFGFPNPFLGLIGWPVVITIAVALLGGSTFARWFWRAFGFVTWLAMIFVFWLFAESVYSLGTLCPWCMVTWVVTITMGVVYTGWSMKYGVWGESVRTTAVGSRILSWAPTLILLVFVIEGTLAQIRLDWIHNL